MNAERLHALAKQIKSEIDETNVKTQLSGITDALQGVISSPDSTRQARLAEAVETFHLTARETTFDSWSPAWRELVRDLGVEDLFGRALHDQISSILSRNSITIATAQQEVSEYEDRIDALYDAVEQLISGFQSLEITAEVLDPGECEIGFLIPRRVVNNELGELTKELKEIDFMVRTIQEIASGTTKPIEVRTISSSDFMVFLKQHSAEGVLFATLVTSLISGYKSILEIRKLHSDLAAKMGASDIPAVKQFAEDHMSKVIKEAVTEGMKFYLTKDSGRRNELKTALARVLNKLADRIDRGFQFEIRMEPLPPSTKNAAGETPKLAAAQDEKRRHYEIIQKVSESLEFSHRDGPPILHLEEKTEGITKPK